MTITFKSEGTVENKDIQRITFILDNTGQVDRAELVYKVEGPNGTESKTINWLLTTAQKNSVASLLPDAKTQLEDKHQLAIVK